VVPEVRAYRDVVKLVAGSGNGLGERNIALGFRIFGFAAHHHNLGGDFPFVLAGLHRFHEGEAHHKNLEFGVVDHEGHFFLGPQGGHRDWNGSQLHDGEVDGHGLRRIGHAQAYPVLGLYSQALQDVGKFIGHGQEFIVGGLAIAEQDGDVVTASLFDVAVEQEFGQVKLVRNRELGRLSVSRP